MCVRDSVCVREREWDAGCERGREVEVREDERKRERGRLSDCVSVRGIKVDGSMKSVLTC